MEEQLKKIVHRDLQKAAGAIGVEAVGVKKPQLIADFLQKLIDLPAEEEANLTDDVHAEVQTILGVFGKDTMEDVIEALPKTGEAPPTTKDKGNGKDAKAEAKAKKAAEAKAKKDPKAKKDKGDGKPKKDVATVKITELVAKNPKASADDILAMLTKEGYKAKRNTVTTVYRFVHLTIDNLKKLNKYKG
jgi:hypothetical protein